MDFRLDKNWTRLENYGLNLITLVKHGLVKHGLVKRAGPACKT